MYRGIRFRVSRSRWWNEINVDFVNTGSPDRVSSNIISFFRSSMFLARQYENNVSVGCLPNYISLSPERKTHITTKCLSSEFFIHILKVYIAIDFLVYRGTVTFNYLYLKHHRVSIRLWLASKDIVSPSFRKIALKSNSNDSCPSRIRFRSEIIDDVSRCVRVSFVTDRFTLHRLSLTRHNTADALCKLDTREIEDRGEVHALSARRDRLPQPCSGTMQSVQLHCTLATSRYRICELQLPSLSLSVSLSLSQSPSLWYL